MEYQHRHHKNLAIYQIGILLIAVMLLVGCRTHWPEGNTEGSLTASARGFTYSTSTGAIWQVDADNHKTQLLADDNVQKWNLSWSPNRQRLAYVAREFLQTGTRETTSVAITTTEGIRVTTPSEVPTYSVNETLVIVDIDGINRRELAGPARAIQYTWVDNYTIDLRLTHQLSDGSERQQWEQFLVDVETGVTTPIEQEDWSTPAPIAPSPNGQWALLFETAGNRGQMHLLDVDGNKVATVYEGSADRDVVSHWSPDSRYVFYLGYAFYETDDIHVYNLLTGENAKVTSFAEQGGSFMIRAPRWSPTGEWIFFWLDTEERIDQPCLVHLSESNVQCFDISAKSNQSVWSMDGRYVAFLAPRGDAPIDIYAIDATAEQLINLTCDGNDTIEDWIAP